MYDNDTPQDVCKGAAQNAVPAKFVQISTMPGCIGGHDLGIFALDSAGIVWHYEGHVRGWESFTDSRAPNLERQRDIDEATKPLHLRIEELERARGKLARG